VRRNCLKSFKNFKDFIYLMTQTPAPTLIPQVVIHTTSRIETMRLAYALFQETGLPFTAVTHDKDKKIVTVYPEKTSMRDIDKLTSTIMAFGIEKLQIDLLNMPISSVKRDEPQKQRRIISDGEVRAVRR
jgi:hypothetical protein